MPICYGKEENRTEAKYTFLKVRNSIIRFHFALLYIKYFCFKTLFVEFNYVVVKYKLLYFEDKETAFKT